MKWYTLSAWVAFAMAASLSNTHANPITINITTTGDVSAGKEQIALVSPLGPGDGLSMTCWGVSVTDGQTASQIADGIANALNSNTTFGPYYKATRGTEVDKDKNGVVQFRFEKVTFTPTQGPNGKGSDFTSGSMKELPGKTPPAGVLIVPKVVAAAPGNSMLKLNPIGKPNPALAIDWKIGVVDQSDTVVAMTTLLAQPDTLPPSVLIAEFAAGLSSQGVPVVASEDTLRLTSTNNDFFVLDQSASGSLLPLLTDSVVPEPACLILFGTGAFGLLAVRWRDRKGRI